MEGSAIALEGNITGSVLDYLNSLPQCIAEKVAGDASVKGRPDINCCYKGQCYRIEMKTADNGNKASKIQKINLRKWRAAGAICFVAYTLEDVKGMIH